MEIRQSLRGSGNRADVPLFGGQYFLNYPFHETGRVHREGLLTLILNPTRFLRYQNPATFVPPIHDFDDSDAILFKRLQAITGGERSLDGSDNWLPMTPEYDRFQNASFFNRATKAYLEAALQEIDTDFTEARSNPGAAVQITEICANDRFNLQEVETYFEFRQITPHPVDSVEVLEALFETFNERTVTRTDYKPHAESRWQKLCRVLTVDIRPGVKLKAYAKTDQRIRFEVTHDLSEARIGNQDENAGHTFPTSRGVYHLLRRLRIDAATIMNDMLSHMKSFAQFPSSSKTVVEFLYDFTGAVGNRDNARTLLNVLVRKQSIDSLDWNGEALRHLKEAGILRTQPRNKRQAHVVTNQYKFALDMLRRNENLIHLTCRNRSRQS